MKVEVGYFTGPRNSVRKEFTSEHTYDMTLKDETSILTPVLLVKTTPQGAGNLAKSSYLYIKDFSRYYFIDDIRSVRACLVEISASVDPLKSWAEKIYEQTALIEYTSDDKAAKMYAEDPKVTMYADAITTTINLKPDKDKDYSLPSSGETVKLTTFTKTPEYILITAGPSGKGGTK